MNEKQIMIKIRCNQTEYPFKIHGASKNGDRYQLRTRVGNFLLYHQTEVEVDYASVCSMRLLDKEGNPTGELMYPYEIVNCPKEVKHEFYPKTKQPVIPSSASVKTVEV